MLLDVNDLCTYFSTKEGVVKAVDHVTVSLDEKQTLGLVGESGSGKSTLGFSILGLVPPPGKIVNGSISFKGENLLQKKKNELRKIRGKEIAMIFQNPMTSLNPVMTIRDHLVEAYRVHEDISEDEAVDRALEILSSLNIREERLDDYPHQFSGGMKQRVMIALALLHKPDLVIADEPTTALDVIVQAQILDLLNELKSQYENSLIAITHDLSVVAELADRIGVMYAGKLVELSDAGALYDEPLHPYTKGLLESIPRVHLSEKLPKTIPGTPPDLIHPPSGCRFHPRCAKAKAICKDEEPKMIKVNGRWVACHLFG